MISFRRSRGAHRRSNCDSSTFNKPGLVVLHDPGADNTREVGFSVRALVSLHVIIMCHARKFAHSSCRLWVKCCANSSSMRKFASCVEGATTRIPQFLKHSGNHWSSGTYRLMPLQKTCGSPELYAGRTYLSGACGRSRQPPYTIGDTSRCS
jgi:hypothetical protein